MRKLKTSGASRLGYECVKKGRYRIIADFIFLCYTSIMTIKAIKVKIVPILKRQGVIKAAIFGSAARNEITKNSDIDILVKLAKNKSLLDLVGLKLELEDKLGRDVDVISYGGIYPLLKSIILKEQKIIYENKKRS